LNEKPGVVGQAIPLATFATGTTSDCKVLVGTPFSMTKESAADDSKHLPHSWSVLCASTDISAALPSSPLALLTLSMSEL
jgi:hypothetical protein